MMGMGAPQARWREMSQSRRRYDVVARPLPSFSNQPMTSGMASGVRRPSNGPEFTMRPSPVHASAIASGSSSLSSGWMTTRTSRPCSRANSKSRWS